MLDYQKAAIEVLSKPGRHVLNALIGEGSVETALHAIRAQGTSITIIGSAMLKAHWQSQAERIGFEDIEIVSPERLRKWYEAEPNWVQTNRPTVIFLTQIPRYNESTKTAQAVLSFVAARKNIIVVRFGKWGIEPLGEIK